MKSMFTALALLLMCSVAQGADCPGDQRKDEATLVQVEHMWLRAVEQHDTFALGCILADEFEEADFRGGLIDRAAMLASALKPRKGGVTELADMHGRIYGDFAYVRGKGLRNDNGVRTDTSRFTDIFVYREGRWQCVAGHESHFPEKR